MEPEIIKPGQPPISRHLPDVITSAPLETAPPVEITITAYHLYDHLKLKPLVGILSGKLIGSSPRELQFKYGKDSYLFIYRFGSLVFVNVDPGLAVQEMKRIANLIGEPKRIPPTESYDVRLGNKTDVEFEYAQVKKMTKDTLRMIAMTLGQSAALELMESRTETMLEDSAKLIEEVSKRGRVPNTNKHFVRMIANTASARQDIVSNLAVMDAPEETWESRSLESLHRDVQYNFEIELRSRILDRKLVLIQENIELLADLSSTRRGLLLETLIVVLIVIELGIAFFDFF
ncbi:MAG: RMD1 family protein [Bdellovibrionaceae bacterium]|nr:RMD1 family protein [Bdellovibrionales bacterium]MCB9255160.1 RMD1 family protein [Pseudobdellovibrionaceae bacterium]